MDSYTAKKQTLFKFSIILLLSALSIFFLFYGHEVWGGVIAISLLVFISLLVSKMELLHPLTWYPPFLLLYSISYPTVNQVENPGLIPMLEETLFLCWVAMLTFIIFSLGIKNKKVLYNKDSLRNMDILLKPLYVITILLTSVYLVYVFKNGLSSKYLIKLDSSPIGKLVLLFRILNVCYFFLLAYVFLVKKKFPKLLILFTVLYTFFCVLVLGERDVFLRIILLTIISYHVLYKTIPRKKLIIIGLLGLTLVPTLANFKNFAVAGEMKDRTERNIVLDIMSAEFSSAARNTNHLLNNDNRWDYLYGETFYWDAKKVLGLGDSTVSWYNNTFFPALVNRGGGNGFALVGEGYLNFDIFGVVIVFAFIALTLRYMYYKSHYSLVWLATYILAIPIVIYSTRADLSTYVSQVIKHAFIPILILYAIRHILERTTSSKVMKHK